MLSVLVLPRFRTGFRKPLILKALKMAYTPRRPTSATERAEALFKAATTKPDATPKATTNSVPKGKEMVSLRIDRDVLEHFQDDGPGWQERINDALRKAAGLE